MTIEKIANAMDGWEDEATSSELISERSSYLNSLGIEQRRVLLVGGSGYIGSVITRDLLNAGYLVRNLDKNIFANGFVPRSFINEQHYEFVYGDIRDEAIMEAALDSVTDVVILAGLVGDPITKKYPEESLAVNGHGVRRLIDGLDGRGLQNVIFVSTCSNYGLMPEGVLATETSPLSPLSTYAEEKVAAEGHLLGKAGAVDYDATALRFATAFGLSPRMRFDLTVNQFTVELMRDDELLVFDADTWRPYCHVKDFSRLIRRVMELPNERSSFQVFNAGGDDNNATKQMIIDMVLKEVPEGKVRYQDHGSDPRNYRVDFSLVREHFGFVPAWSITDGIEEIAQAARSGFFELNEDEDQQQFGNYKITGLDS